MKVCGFFDVLKAFQEAGLFNNKAVLQKLIREGRLVMPRNMVNGRYYLLPEQVESIVKEFLPGGNGRWDWTEQNE